MSGAEAIFGIVAGGAGLLSLSVQLGESVIKLRQIYNAARDMPKTISKIMFGLESIAIALQDLEQQRQQSGHNSALLLRCITQCQQSTAEVQQLVDELEAKLASYSRFGRKINILLRDPEVRDLLNKLTAATNSLELAYMIYLGDQQRRLFQAQMQYSAFQSAQLQSLQNQVSAMDANVIREITLLKEQSQTRQILPAHTAVSRGNTISEVNAVSTINTKGPELEHKKNDLYPSALPKSKRKETKFRVRLRLPSSICASIWNLAIIRSQNSWCLSMQSYNVVPENSKIFYHCRRGHLDEVRRMFLSGEASPFDVIYGQTRDQTLLEEAAYYGQLEICRYLLCQAALPDIDLTLCLALNSYAIGDGSRGISREFYSLFTGRKEFHLNVEDAISSTTLAAYSMLWLFRCSDTESLNIILHNAFPGFDNCPIQARFELACQLPHLEVSGFLRCIGLEASDPRLATLRSSYGKSALHWVARRLRQLPGFEGLLAKSQREIYELGVEILKNGADPCSMMTRSLPTTDDTSGTNHGSAKTPLMFQLNLGDHLHVYDYNRSIQSISIALHVWVKMLEDACVDLCSYGGREKQIWNAISIQGHPIDRHHTVDFVFGPTPANWGLKITRTESITLYKIQTPPGSFPTKQYLPSLIAWHPSNEDESEGHWSRVEKIDLFSTELNLHGYEKPSESNSDLPPFVTLMNDTQDDLGTVALMQDRACRKRIVTGRSCSQPPLLRRRDLEYLEMRWYKTRPWLPSYHLCPLDSRWKSNCIEGSEWLYLSDGNSIHPCDVRSCLKGLSRGISPLQASFDWEWSSFLSDVARCKDGKGWWRPYYNPGGLNHSYTPDCPQGCDKIRLNCLAVPKPLLEYHPRSDFETIFG